MIDLEQNKINDKQILISQLIFNGNFNYIEPEQKIITDKLITARGKKVYFIRFAESPEKGRKAIIMILNEIICLPEKYNHQFVFVEWDIEKEHLLIYSEFEQQIILIHQVKFKLNI